MGWRWETRVSSGIETRCRTPTRSGSGPDRRHREPHRWSTQTQTQTQHHDPHLRSAPPQLLRVYGYSRGPGGSLSHPIESGGRGGTSIFCFSSSCSVVLIFRFFVFLRRSPPPFGIIIFVFLVLLIFLILRFIVCQFDSLLCGRRSGSNFVGLPICIFWSSAVSCLSGRTFRIFGRRRFPRGRRSVRSPSLYPLVY